MSSSILTGRLVPVLLGIHLVALPLYPHLPPLVLVATAFLSLWLLLISFGRAAQPGRFVLLMLTLFVVVVLMQSFGTILGQMPGSAMLLLLSFLKLFEMRSTRDVAIVIFMGYFLVASKFFYSQSLLIALHVFIAVVYLTSLLIVFSDRVGTTRFDTRMYKSLRMIAQAVPLMLIMFVLFPRMPGPLWGLPNDASTATSGLSDEMSPGSINRLVGSGEVAFRAKFENRPPPRSQLYWRGLVLSNYDGRTWRLDNAPSQARPFLLGSGEDAAEYVYTVMLEPHNRRWLYALESLVEYDGNYLVNRELQLLSPFKVTDVKRYMLRSDTAAQNRGLFEVERSKNLALPAGFNQATEAFAQKLLAESGNDSSTYMNMVLDYFRRQPFSYTLSPPLLGRDAMDEFLFGTRKGFCEHFASAFVYLMRAAGIPARVVIGYQGGSMHPFDDYMIVRQSDAHAWSEVWLDDLGWLRVDPTAAVSPTRIESGIENAGLERELLPAILISDNLVFQRARFIWDSFHNNWNQWVVGYNRERQQELFNMLGIDAVDNSKLLMWLVASMTLAGSLMAWWVIRREPGRRADVIRMHYDRLCRKLKKAGVEHQPNEGASEFLKRVVEVLPAREHELVIITDDYERLRYGNVSDEQLIKRFIRAVRRFRTYR